MPKIIEVSELGLLIKKSVEGIGFVSIIGEVSGFLNHSSGNVYFSLKDKNSVLNCVCWKYHEFPKNIKDGDMIVCHGLVTTYQGGSRYQLNVKSAELTGAGNLLKIIEERKKKLAVYFQTKRDISRFPKKIGIITSETGAVLRDMLKRLTERYVEGDIIVENAVMQGVQSTKSICAAIDVINDKILNLYPGVIRKESQLGEIFEEKEVNVENKADTAVQKNSEGPFEECHSFDFNENNPIIKDEEDNVVFFNSIKNESCALQSDECKYGACKKKINLGSGVDEGRFVDKINPTECVIIIARGGGSIEDLWSFNDEELVKKVSNNIIPIISAIGHETDTNLIDYAADLRAPTPTAAAEIVSRECDEIKYQVDLKCKSIKMMIEKILKYKSEKISMYKSFFKENFFDSFYQKFDLSVLRFQNAIRLFLERKKNILPRVQGVNSIVASKKSILDKYNFNIEPIIEFKKNQLNSAIRLTQGLSYAKVLERGFCIVESIDCDVKKDTDGINTSEGRPIKRLRDLSLLKKGSIINISSNKVKLIAEVKDKVSI